MDVSSLGGMDQPEVHAHGLEPEVLARESLTCSERL
jgi:hypothetical protein